MRTLDDIVPPSRRKEPAAEFAADHAPLRPRKPRSGFPYVSGLIALVVLLGAFGAIWYYSGATVEVTPSASTVSASGSYTASAQGGTLPFQIITADKIATQSVQSSGSQEVSSVATGSITITSTEATAQRLVATTRFEDPNGLIFHIKNGVTVPAHGSVQAAVYADQPGATYNIGPSTFTVPGLTGAAHAEVSGTSASSMTGGASGEQPVVASATDAATRASLKTALAPDLNNQLAGEVPQGYVLLPGASATTYQDLAPVASATTGMVDIKEEGTITAVVMPNAALAAALAMQVEADGYDGAALTIQNPNSLTLTPATGLPAATDTSFSFSLSGTASLLSTIDPNQIASAVAGKTRTAAEVALTNYPSVKQAVLILRPFWESTFPEDPAKITVVIEPGS